MAMRVVSSEVVVERETEGRRGRMDRSKRKSMSVLYGGFLFLAEMEFFNSFCFLMLECGQSFEAEEKGEACLIWKEL